MNISDISLLIDRIKSNTNFNILNNENLIINFLKNFLKKFKRNNNE